MSSDPNNWFNQTFGFFERRNNVPAHLTYNKRTYQLESCLNNHIYRVGKFSTLSLRTLQCSELADIYRDVNNSRRALEIRIVVADVQKLHQDPAYCNATFQVDSPFHCLASNHQNVTPSAGITMYENNKTQGAACSIACGAGTCYRNYFHEVEDGKQIDNASHFLDVMFPRGHVRCQNGYLILTPRQILTANTGLTSATPGHRQRLKGLIRVGVQSNTEVTPTIRAKFQHVTQVFASAFPLHLINDDTDVRRITPTATLLLEAAYEATLLAAIQNRRDNCSQNASNTVVLTLLGVGTFGNNFDTVLETLVSTLALPRIRQSGLDVVLNVQSEQEQTAVQTVVSVANRMLKRSFSEPTL
jgi:hypothetical protein